MVFLEILAFFPQRFLALRGGGRVIYTHFFYFSARFGCFSGHLALWQGGKYFNFVYILKYGFLLNWCLCRVRRRLHRFSRLRNREGTDYIRFFI